MIVVRAPLRISFVGGGTDLPDFCKLYQGRVISTTIDKYVYIVLNRTPLVPKISARYTISETVDRPEQLHHTRIKAALLDLKIKKGLEIASFASLPAKTGLGSSSSFSVALMKGLYAYQGKKLTQEEAAELACQLEINLLNEPIGKQDQYAASFGGLNIFEFNTNGKVKVMPVMLSYKMRHAFEDHLLLFFTGLTRDASTVLKEQKLNIKDKIQTLRKMADSVNEFSEKLSAGDFRALGKMLHEGWLMKKSLATTISNSIIDKLYDQGIKNGAWGGKILGAGGGGCILFIAPVKNRAAVRSAVTQIAKTNNLKGFQEIPIKFVQSGAEILFNVDQK